MVMDRGLIGLTYHQNFNATNDVHGGSECRSDEEEEAYSAAELGTQIAGDHKVGTSRRHDPVRCNSTHTNGRQHSLQK